MNETRCTCCDLPASSCGKAIEQAQRRSDAAEKPPHGATTTARFPSRCTYCGTPIRAGEQLSHDEEHGWIHDECATTLDGP